MNDQNFNMVIFLNRQKLVENLRYGFYETYFTKCIVLNGMYL